MKLAEICEELTYTCLQGEMEKEISDIIYDSRKVEKDTVFVCMVGAVVDGHDFVEDAVKKGAAALVVEHAVGTDIPENCTVLQVEDARYALAIMSAAFFGHPDRELTTIGLTGTKGKTTTTYMIKSVLEEAGKKVGLIGTIGALIGEEKLPAKNTTPESYELHKMFRAMVDAGCEYVVMEVSSQGLKMHRVAGIVFDYGIFTNLSPDHIGPNEHASFEEYQECKSLLFRQCKEGIVNADDEHVDGIIKNHKMQILPPEHIKDYLEAADRRGLLPMFYLELVTGLRKGEITALLWSDLDAKNKTISVSKQYVKNPNGELTLSRPKTETSVRKISIPQEAVDLLMAEHGKHPETPYMFPSPVTGEMYYPDSVVNLHKKILKDAGLPHIRFHDLRHTFATLALQNGVDVKTVSSMLGHYDAGFTLRTYTHATRQKQDEAAQTMGSFMAQVM